MASRPRLTRGARGLLVCGALAAALGPAGCLESTPKKAAKAEAGTSTSTPAEQSDGNDAASSDNATKPASRTRKPDRTTAKKPTPGEDLSTKSVPPSLDDGCCRYCMDDSVPCGDQCVAAGQTCEAAEGCACAQDKRRPPVFKKGSLAREGLIRADVAAYNAAQGDPIVGDFTLEQAFEGAPELADSTAGTLTAVLTTSMGEFSCELFEVEAPLTVASFVGLARGVRPFLDEAKGEWVKRPYFDGSIFHRVIAGFMVQGGDPSGRGNGSPGFFIPDEFSAKRRHKGAGVLSMANRNPVDRKTQKLMVDPRTNQLLGNTGSAQFFVTVASATQLDDRHTVFGQCEPTVPVAISKVEVINNQNLGYDHRPRDEVKLESVKILRRK